jgi:putative oxidoreductase
MTNDKNVDLAAFVLRIASGVLFLAHGGLKMFAFGFAGTAGFFQSLGLPGPLAYLVIIVEILGGAALILGFQTRIVAIILGIDLLGAAWFGHAANGWMFANANGGWEYPVYWAVTMFVLALMGDGAYALGKGKTGSV